MQFICFNDIKYNLKFVSRPFALLLHPIFPPINFSFNVDQSTGGARHVHFRFENNNKKYFRPFPSHTKCKNSENRQKKT